MTSSTLVVPVMLLGFFAGSMVYSATLVPDTLSYGVQTPVSAGRRLLQITERVKTPPFFNGYFDMVCLMLPL